MRKTTPEKDLVKARGILKKVFEKAADAWFLADDTRQEFYEEVKDDLEKFHDILERNDYKFIRQLEEMLQSKFEEYESNLDVRAGKDFIEGLLFPDFG